MLVRVLAVIALVVLNGFFVGAEFALVRVATHSAGSAWLLKGDRLAGLALRATTNIRALLSASQLGVTLRQPRAGLGRAIGLPGVLAQRARRACHSRSSIPLRLTIAGAIALAVVTYLHVVFGELAPKGAALLHPEGSPAWLVPPLMVWAWLTTPFTVLLNRSAQAVLHATRPRQRRHRRRTASIRPEELRLLVEQAEEGGALERHDAAMLDAVFEFSEKNAREVMTPRTEIVALPSDATLDRNPRDRAPRAGSRDTPSTPTRSTTSSGILLAKDLIKVAARAPGRIHARRDHAPGPRDTRFARGRGRAGGLQTTQGAHGDRAR